MLAAYDAIELAICYRLNRVRNCEDTKKDRKEVGSAYVRAKTPYCVWIIEITVSCHGGR